MRSALAYVFFMGCLGFGCDHDRPVSPVEQSKSLEEIECVLRWTTLGAEWFAEEMKLYAHRDSEVILGCYRGSDVQGNISAPIESLEIRKEEDTALKNPFGLPEYHLTFAVSLTGVGAKVDPVAQSFFDHAGRQNLGPEDDIWLHFVAHKPGRPVSTNTGVSAAGYEQDLGECWLVYR